MTHADDFMLLRLIAGDVTDAERVEASSHIQTCKKCRRAFSELKEVDKGLHRLALAGLLGEDVETEGLPARDPFRRRPGPSTTGARSRRSTRIPVEAIRIGSRAASLQQRIRNSLGAGTIRDTVRDLDFDDVEHRFAVLYALQETGRRITEGPLRASTFAEATIRRLRHCRAKDALSETMVPRVLLWGQAHALAAQACLWTREFARAGVALRIAYRAFGEAADDTGLAIVELAEAQRRALGGEGEAALTLARRARATFEDRALDDLAARALVAEGLAHFDLRQQEQAVDKYRLALPIFERYELWANYVGTLNSLGTSLTRLGRMEEARREYARALRRFSKKEHQSWQGFLRVGLAEIFFSAERFQEAARAAAGAGRSFHEGGLRANELIVLLLEVEAWTRHGNTDRAHRRFNAFRDAALQEEVLDRQTRRQIEKALSKAKRDVGELSRLRAFLDERLLRMSSASE